MVIAAVEIKLYLPWVHSLKEKRMAVKSVLQKTQHHFHVSAAEVDYQEVQQSAAIAFARCHLYGRASESSVAEYHGLRPSAYTGGNHKYRQSDLLNFS